MLSFVCDGSEVRFRYLNYRGELSVRFVRPRRVYHGSSEHHPEPQWLLEAWDLGKQAVRTFALKDVDPLPPATYERQP